MNRHAAKLAVFWLSCVVLGGNSRACVPLDIEIYYDLLYTPVGTYNLYNGPQVVSGGPVKEIDGGCGYAWQWGCDSGLNWALNYVDGDIYGVSDIGAATPGVYAEYAVGCNESGSYDTDCAYVVVLPNVTIGSIDRVPPGKTKSVSITVSSSDVTIDLDMVLVVGGAGSASVSPTSITGSATVIVTGGGQTSTNQSDKVTLRASCGGITLASQEFFVCAHPKSFSAVGYAPLTYVPDYGPVRGVLVRYTWGSDSDYPAHLDQCWGSESFTGFAQDQPPFYADGLEGGDPSPMVDGFADDQRAVPLAAIRNYCTGDATYTQSMLWECRRCGEEGTWGSCGTNSVGHHVSGPPWKITTTISGIPPVEQSLP